MLVSEALTGQAGSEGMSKAGIACVETVANILEGYAKRGVFRGFGRGPTRKGQTIFRMIWHRDRVLELALDPDHSTMKFLSLLPQLPTVSAMYRDLKEFIRSRHSESLPEHRRIDVRKAQVRCSNQLSTVTVSVTVRDGDYEYGTRKLIHIVNEIFMVFLADGRYREYVVNTFDLEPDAV